MKNKNLIKRFIAWTWIPLFWLFLLESLDLSTPKWYTPKYVLTKLMKWVVNIKFFSLNTIHRQTLLIREHRAIEVCCRTSKKLRFRLTSSITHPITCTAYWKTVFGKIHVLRMLPLQIQFFKRCPIEMSVKGYKLSIITRINSGELMHSTRTLVNRTVCCTWTLLWE